MNWLKSIPQFLELFKEGKEISNAATWQNRTVAANACVALLGTCLVIAKTFGYAIELDQETMSNLGAGIVAVVAAVNAVMHTITSKNVGLSPDGISGTGSGNSIDME